MFAPSVNIVMTFDRTSMQTFLDSDTLSGFIKESTNEEKGVFIFRNGPASMFLGLEHSYGYGQAASKSVQSPKIRLEFLDPEGGFEDHLLDYSIAASIPDKTNIRDYYKQEIIRIDNEIAELDAFANAQVVRDRLSQLGQATDDTNVDFEKELEENEELRKVLEAEKEGVLADQEDAIGSHEFAAEGLDEKRQKQLIDYQRSFAKRPVWIAYGVGNKLRDWSPPMQFKELTKAEYDFKGDGARILKMEYDGVGIHPDLDSTYGIPETMLGSLGGGIVVRHGKSQRLFHAETNENLHKFYSKLFSSAKYSGNSDAVPMLIDKYFGTEGDFTFHISYHETIINVLSSFIKGCINNDNVGVFFPDLDVALLNFVSQMRSRMAKQFANWGKGGWTQYGGQGGTSDEPLWVPDPDGNMVKMQTKTEAKSVDAMREIIIEVETAKAVFAELGFRVQEDRADQDGSLHGVSLPALHSHQDALKNPTALLDMLVGMDIRVALIGTGKDENYADIIRRFSEKLERVMTNYPSFQSIQNFKTASYIETDVRLLKIWFNHGLIGDGSRPAVIFGEHNFINSILLGRVFNSLGSEVDLDNGKFSLEIQKLGLASKSLSHRVSPLSMLRGLDDAFFADMWLYKNPPAWVGPFGDQFADWSFEGGETVVFPGMNMTADDSYKAKFKNMPMFSLGTANPNVLSVSFDINNLYYAYLNSFGYSGNNSSQAITTLIPASLKPSLGKIVDNIPYGQTSDPQTTGGNLAGQSGDAPAWFIDMIDPYISAAEGDVDSDTFKSWRYILATMGEADLDEIDRLKAGKGQIFGFSLPKAVLGTPISNANRVKNDFILLLWRSFIAIRNKLPKTTVIIDAADPSLGVVGHHVKMFDKLAREVLVGNIRTLPYFHLSSYYSTINREALLYCKEPRILNTNKDKLNDMPQSQLSWFSGMYEIIGFKHTIKNESAFSEFLIIRNPLISTTATG